MKDIMKELFYTFEDTSLLNTPEQEKANKAEERLKKRLGKKERKLLSDFYDAHIDVDIQHAQRDFKTGFCLGCRLMFEVFNL